MQHNQHRRNSAGQPTEEDVQDGVLEDIDPEEVMPSDVPVEEWRRVESTSLLTPCVFK